MTPATTLLVTIIAVAVGLAAVRRFARPTWNRVMTVVNRILDIEIGIALPRSIPPAELYYQHYPRRLQLNIPALILGPIWYLLAGLWVHATILLTIAFLSGGLLAPLVWLYCGLKASEDLLEFRVARHNVY
ncbi:MAG: hypothetical protein QN183_12425 [Armatimonadota bacterium]|nr:hypothetical protein [Armatimonadota bacterium]MDR7485279.1 hypothetical protein [Armatimonadota bacterium]MDR7537155.1 hypothetical protein [Armatimonadota bacterium]